MTGRKTAVSGVFELIWGYFPPNRGPNTFGWRNTCAKADSPLTFVGFGGYTLE